MIKIMVPYVFMSIVATSLSIEKEATSIPTAKRIAGEEAIVLKTLDLDGFRYIKKLHKDVGVEVFWN